MYPQTTERQQGMTKGRREARKEKGRKDAGHGGKGQKEAR